MIKNPNNKLYLLNGYNNLFQQQQQSISGLNSEKIQRLEIEKFNLECQVKLLKKQLNVDLISMMQHKQQKQQYLNNNEYIAKILLMTMNNNNNKTSKVIIINLGMCGEGNESNAFF
jgi:alpha-D-ribose 1-methylphosphonate 5-triphosphate diphosphatase PhnM